MKIAAFLIAAAMMAPAAANAAVTVVNGSFEQGTDPGTFITLAPGSTAITGWTVGGNRGTGIDYIGSYWEASDGDRSIDLSGNGPGTLSQVLTGLTVGQSYQVNFDLAGNPDGGQGVKLALVQAVIGGAPGIEQFTVDASTSRQDMNWSTRLYRFTAQGTSATLTFSSLTDTAFGPALDNVGIAAVPEPASWAMMIMGVGLVGGALRSRRRVALATA